MISLLETYLSVYSTPQEASNKLFKGISQGMELAPEIAQEDEEKRLYVLQYLSHVDITKTSKIPSSKKIVWNLSKGLISQNPLSLPLFITLGALSPLKRSGETIAKTLCVGEALPTRGDRRFERQAWETP